MDCMKAGMDVLLEKPMVLNEKEAKKLIKARDKYKRLLVVAFPGSLSPAINKAKELINKQIITKKWYHMKFNCVFLAGLVTHPSDHCISLSNHCIGPSEHCISLSEHLY